MIWVILGLVLTAVLAWAFLTAIVGLVLWAFGIKGWVLFKMAAASGAAITAANGAVVLASGAYTAHKATKILR
jgi:hypothetical protein